MEKIGWTVCVRNEGRNFDFRWGSVEFFIALILPAALRAPGSTQYLTEMSIRDFLWGVNAACAKDTFLCRLSKNSGSSNLLDSCRPVQALLYLTESQGGDEYCTYSKTKEG